MADGLYVKVSLHKMLEKEPIYTSGRNPLNHLTQSNI